MSTHVYNQGVGAFYQAATTALLTRNYQPAPKRSTAPDDQQPPNPGMYPFIQKSAWPDSPWRKQACTYHAHIDNPPPSRCDKAEVSTFESLCNIVLTILTQQEEKWCLF